MKQIQISVCLRHLSILSLLLIGALPGCLYTRTHPIGIEPIAKESGQIPYEIIGEAEGESSSLTLFGLMRVTRNADFNEAVNLAIRSKGGDNLIDVISWRERNVYMIGAVDVIRVKGKVIRYVRDKTKNFKG